MRFRDACILAFCRLGVAGLAPKAPGTWGTALACLLAPCLFLPLGMGGRALVLLLLVWLVLLPFAEPGFWLVAAAFVFFRIFDIAKPWPVRASENWLPDGFGVMLDDVLAGLWALLCVWGLHWAGLF